MDLDAKARAARATRRVAVAGGLVLLGAVVLFVGYAHIPSEVVLSRPPWAQPTLGPKSWLTVGRIAGMGVGQVGAATALFGAARGASHWERFWSWLALSAGVKTLLECVGFVVPRGSSVELALGWSTAAVVVSFLVAAALWWRRGELRAHPRLAGAPRLGVIAALTLWMACALAARWPLG